MKSLKNGSLTRRRLLQVLGVSSLAGGPVLSRFAFAPAAATTPNTDSEPSANFLGGKSAIKLSAHFKSGPLKVEVREFSLGTDRTVIINGHAGSAQFYRAFFSQDNDSRIFAVIRDEDHSTTVALKEVSS